MDFLTQVCYFWHATLVIGQYGSGLVNVLWMRLGTSCIELTAHKFYNKDKVFEKCCKSRGVLHYPIFCNAVKKEWTVPINTLKQTLGRM